MEEFRSMHTNERYANILVHGEGVVGGWGDATVFVKNVSEQKHRNAKYRKRQMKEY